MSGKRLAEAQTADDIAAAMASLNRAVERELSTSGPDAIQVACGPGCAACCVVNVSVLVPEAVAIAAYLQKNFPELSEIRERLDLLADRVRWMDDGERPRFRLACAFLDEQGCCMIHPVRPILCRSVSSTDADACHDALQQGGAVLMNLPQKIFCTLLFTGLGNVLQNHGMDCRSLELSRMVGNLLENPLLTDRFLSRKRVAFK